MTNKEEYYEKIEQELLMHSLLPQAVLINTYRKKYDLDKMYPDLNVLERMEEAGEAEPVPFDLLLNTFYTDDSADEYLRQIDESNCLNQSEMQELVLKAKTGDMHAREQLVEGNELLIASIARKYVGFPLLAGEIRYKRLIDIGKDEFSLAIDEYNAETGIRFLPFATWCIHHVILKYAEYLQRAEAFRKETAQANKIKYQTYERQPSEEVLTQLACKYSGDHTELPSTLEIYNSEPVKQILEEIKKDPYSSIEEENEFALNWAAVYKEKNMLLGSLGRLDLDIISEYYYFAGKEGLCIPLFDESNFFSLMQDAGVGLIKALESYEQSKASSFRSYAAWFMHWIIIEGILQENTIVEMPGYPLESVLNIESTYLKLEEDHDPTYQELTEKAGYSIKKVRYYLQPEPKLTFVQELQKEYQEALHLNETDPSAEALHMVKDRSEYVVLDLDALKERIWKEGEVLDYLNQVAMIPSLEKEEENRLFDQYHAGDDSAKKAIIKANLKLVFSIVIRVADRYLENIGTISDRDVDLILDGNEGLVEAVEKYDKATGFDFQIFAAWYIHRRIYEGYALKIRKEDAIEQVYHYLYGIG